MSKNFVAGKAIRIAKIIVIKGIVITLIIFFFASQAARIVMKAARATIKKLGLMIWANRHIKNR
ncbi:hypothetical protein, partial [Oenococcus oeni]|uniref:hypothetical protein n=1 Tax=Oenococcus oeni TaxID=1247 RepID=UPI00214AF51D